MWLNTGYAVTVANPATATYSDTLKYLMFHNNILVALMDKAVIWYVKIWRRGLYIDRVEHIRQFVEQAEINVVCTNFIQGVYNSYFNTILKIASAKL